MGNGCYLKELLVVEAGDDACSVESVTSDSSSEELNEALPVNIVHVRARPELFGCYNLLAAILLIYIFHLV